METTSVRRDSGRCRLEAAPAIFCEGSSSAAQTITRSDGTPSRAPSPTLFESGHSAVYLQRNEES
jgi:hypothetical protein